MVTRRDLLRFAGLGTVATVAGCSGRSDAPPRSARGPVVYADTSRGLAALDVTTGKVQVAAAPMVAAPGWQRLASAVSEGGATVVVLHRTGGEAVARIGVSGRYAVRALSADGGLVALSDPGGETFQPAGRGETTIVVADTRGERARFTLAGCVEPEAFSADGQTLYVLDYLPPLQPDRYRVRAVDIATAMPGPLYNRNKVLVNKEEEMRGVGRQAVYSPTRGLLFTLYTHQPDHVHSSGRGGTHAFIHTLSLREGWAYCVDLPHPFGEGPAAGHALALSPDERWVAAVDATGGKLAMVAADQLTVTTVFPVHTSAGAEAALAFAGDSLYYAAGDVALQLRAGSLEALDRWMLPGAARGIAAAGSDPVFGYGSTVQVGRTGPKHEVPGLTRVRHAVFSD